MLRDFIQTSEELAVIEPERKPGEENIHYGEIKFSKRTPGPSSDSVQECRQELDSVYSQVQVSAPVNRFLQTVDGPEGDGLMAGLFVNVVIVGVFGLSGALAPCPRPVHLHITAPEKMEALEGSCLQIPCNYSAVNGGKTNFDNKKEIVGMWMKQNDKYPVNIIGNLTENNCTSLISNLSQSHTDTYLFRIENGDFKATADCDPLHITINDSPWRPTINIPDDLKENERVTITCSAVTPCPHSPPELTCNLQQDFHTQTEKNNDGTFTTKIQKNITLSDTHDGYNISCSVRYPVNEGKHFKTSQTAKTLNVSYAPKDTSASISLVSAGSWVNLTCSSRANPPVSRFTWFKKSEDGDMKVAVGDFYILNVADGGVFYCVATNDVGNQTSADISLNVWKIVRYVIVIIFLVGCVRFDVVFGIVFLLQDSVSAKLLPTSMSTVYLMTAAQTVKGGEIFQYVGCPADAATAENILPGGQWTDRSCVNPVTSPVA
ncbi:B-cell receptor CD22-like [Xenentodon cancila]